MIDKLTPEQELKIPQYCKKWEEIGFNTKPINRKESEEAIKKYLAVANIKCDSVLFFPSPMMCNFAYTASKNMLQLRNQLSDQLWGQIERQFGNQIVSQLGNQLSDQLWGQLVSQLGNQLRIMSQLKSQIKSQIRNQLVSQLESQLESQLMKQLVSQLGRQLMNQLINQLMSQIVSQLVSQIVSQLGRQLNVNVYGWTDGQCASGWCNFYDFLISELKELDKNTKVIWDIYINYVRSSFWIYPFDGICFASDRPVEMNFINGRLHNEKGMSVRFSDGWGIYSLNGVLVNEELVMTPAEKLDPNLALNEKNADVQREIIRKIGYEKILKVSGAKTIDDWQDHKTGLKYSLKRMKIGENINRIYICYEHASMPGVFYIKPVPPETTKCWQARAYQTKILDRENITRAREEEITKLLPEWVV